MSTARDHTQIIQVFKQFLIFFNGQNNRFAFAIFDDVFRRRFARSHHDELIISLSGSQLAKTQCNPRLQFPDLEERITRIPRIKGEDLEFQSVRGGLEIFFFPLRVILSSVLHRTRRDGQAFP